MTPRDAEKLLGGYATGTLSEAERRELFAAALEDQGLFDALADEEALRELLADPAARSRLLEVLAKPAPAPVVRPLWRRPAVMGLAATLLAAVGAGLLMKRTDLPEPYRAVKPEPPSEAKPAPPPAQPPPSAQSQVQREPAPKPSPKIAPPPPPPPAETREALGRVWSAPQRTAPPKPAPPETLSKSEGAADKLAARQDQPSVLAEAAAGVAGGAPASAPAPAAPRAEEKKARRRAEEPTSQAPVLKPSGDAVHGLAMDGSNFAPSPSEKPLDRLGAIVVPPAWKLEPAAPGRFRLKVTWGPQGHLYLLHRGAAGVSVLTPATNRLAGGRTETGFAGTVEAGEALDLYLLADPAASPASLPAEGLMQGFRARVWPEKK